MNGKEDLHVEVTDSVDTASATYTIDVKEVNDAPTLTMPFGFECNQGDVCTFAGAEILDVDQYDIMGDREFLSAEITVVSGTLTASRDHRGQVFKDKSANQTSVKSVKIYGETPVDRCSYQDSLYEAGTATARHSPIVAPIALTTTTSSH